MIPCFVCGKDASINWVCGLPPAPDSQKMALCSEHDTPEARIEVEKAWEELLSQKIVAVQDAVKHNKIEPVAVLTVRFVAGGMLSFPCVKCEQVEHDALRIKGEDGSYTFIPLRQVAEYTIAPSFKDLEDNNV